MSRGHVSCAFASKTRIFVAAESWTADMSVSCVSPQLGNAHHNRQGLIVNNRADRLEARHFNAAWRALPRYSWSAGGLARYALFSLEAMKIKGFALGLTLTMLVCMPSFAAETKDEDALQPAAQSKSGNSVSELRNQDSVFSILIEAFRQVQGRVIQTDYEARIKAANALDDLKTRRRVVVLARQERELRVQKLYHEIGNLNLSYDHTRRDDERAAGVEVPVHIDTGHAAKTLMDYVFIAPAANDESGEFKTKTVPASNYLLDKMPEPVE